MKKFGWESQREKIKRHLRVPSKKKMEWLLQMRKLAEAVSSPRELEMRRRLRING
jgi:hypothetical protein